MPRPHPTDPTLYSASFGGDGALLSVGRGPTHESPPQVVLGPTASGDMWLNAREIVTFDKSIPALIAFDPVTKAKRELLPGITDLTWFAAGGGRFASASVSRGVMLDGRPISVTPVGFGHDGTLAYRDPVNRGCWLTPPGHMPGTAADVMLTPDAMYVVPFIIGPGQAVWQEGRAVRALNVPGWPATVQTLTGDFNELCALRLDGRWQVAYNAFDHGLVMHPADDASRGRRLQGVGNCWRLGVSTELAVWSVVNRDWPQDVRAVRLADVPVVSLGTSTPPPPPPPDEENMAILRAFEFTCWFSPIFSFSERYGDPPAGEEYLGNAITVVEDERDPAVLARELDRVSRRNLPMIVEGGRAGRVDPRHLNLIVAWWAAGNRVDSLGGAVVRSLGRADRPVVAYLDADSWPAARPSWVDDRVWPTVQAYRFPGEALGAFVERVSAVLDRVAAYGRPMGLVPRWDNFNGQGSVEQTLEAMDAYEAWMRAYPFAAVLPFADRRPGGMASDARLRSWARAFLYAVPSGRPSRDDNWVPAHKSMADVLRNQLAQSRTLIALDAARKAYILRLLPGSGLEPDPDDPGQNPGPVRYREFGDYVVRRWTELEVEAQIAAVRQRTGIRTRDEMKQLEDDDPERFADVQRQFRAVQIPAIVRIAGELYHEHGNRDVGLSTKNSGNHWELPDGRRVATDIITVRPTDARGAVVDGPFKLHDVLSDVGGPETTAGWSEGELNEDDSRPWAEPPRP